VQCSRSGPVEIRVTLNFSMHFHHPFNYEDPETGRRPRRWLDQGSSTTVGGPFTRSLPLNLFRLTEKQLLEHRLREVMAPALEYSSHPDSRINSPKSGLRVSPSTANDAEGPNVL
jgi:hypothetical protein